MICHCCGRGMDTFETFYHMKKLLLLIFLFWCVPSVFAQQTSFIDLSGIWRFQTDMMGFGKTAGSELYKTKLSETIYLPGTTDLGGKGIATTARHIDRLSRKFEYCGQAWYQREFVVPKGWDNKKVVLLLERCHWVTEVFIDGKSVGEKEHLCVPNRFEIPLPLKPGVHTLTICVDNRLKYPMDQWNHGTTEYTQTNWNGIVGKIGLVAHERTYLSSVKVFPNIVDKNVRLAISIKNEPEEKAGNKLLIRLLDHNGKKVAEKEETISLKKGDNLINREMGMGKSVQLWDEFNPNLYKVQLELVSEDKRTTLEQTFGMREVSQGEHHIRLNNKNIHLRGVLDCCVFPLTGYPPTDSKEWKTLFRTVKDYGFNHVRFHSWCPPEAAFVAADELGLYLQVELPMWIKDVGKYPARRLFFEKEMYAILDEYGNHPSFILMCNGNENEGDFSVLEDLVRKGMAYDDRHLFSASTARTHTQSDQYYVSHVTKKGWITVYEGKPSTNWDRSKESDIDVPVIAHETGQRCMYPNFEEMKKYTGVLSPRNFEVFKERLTQHGMLDQATDFFKATGAHTVLQYKEVNESLLRTKNSGGFQLLGLSDFPGQGSAFVGILDAFAESKGLVSAEKYRESCAPTVLLARLDKRTFTPDERFKVQFEIYHFGEFPIKKGTFRWALKDENRQVIQSGTFSTGSIECGTVRSLNTIDLPLHQIDSPQKLTLHATVDGKYHNEWSIWVYPKTPKVEKNGFLYATHYNDRLKKALEEGQNVLLIPEKIKGRKARFASHFWNPIMFNWDPMIVGTLIDSKSGAFNDFPTDSFADWQWWDILNHATAVDLEDCKGMTPIIQSIDSYQYNNKLGIAFEANVANGRLFVLCVDPVKDIDRRLATKQLIYSVENYLSSKEFKPQARLDFYQLDKIFDLSEPEAKEKELNSSVEQLWNH